MNSLIEDLLTYSQVNLRPATLETVDLNEVIDIVLSELDLEIEQKDAKVSINKLGTVKGHRRQLQQAFQNLLINALKYSSPERTPAIEVKTARFSGKDLGLNISPEAAEREYCLIEVRDNGIGFDASDAERIFNVFTRLVGNSETKGTGVGLSIVRKVVENHKGFVVAEGKPGEGAAFKVYLPV
jgi:signal transduction histidine kinase